MGRWLVLKKRNQGAFEVFSHINRNLDEETMDAEFKDLIKEKEKGSKMALMEILQWKYIYRYQISQAILSRVIIKMQKFGRVVVFSLNYTAVTIKHKQGTKCDSTWEKGSIA